MNDVHSGRASIRSRQSSFYGDDLAWLHSRYYSDFVAKAAPQIIRMLRAEGISDGIVCDLGCGGGQLSAALLKAGYEVAGIDISGAMIALARKRAASATFIKGSIAEVRLPACSAAIAVGEVFNYMGSSRKMLRAFRNVLRALRPRGRLIFDVKEPPARKITRMSCRTGPDWAVLAEITEDPTSNRLVRTIDSFRKVGHTYRRQTEVHRLAIYPAPEVKAMLEAVGFRARIRSGYGNFVLGDGRKVVEATL